MLCAVGATVPDILFPVHDTEYPTRFRKLNIFDNRGRYALVLFRPVYDRRRPQAVPERLAFFEMRWRPNQSQQYRVYLHLVVMCVSLRPLRLRRTAHQGKYRAIDIAQYQKGFSIIISVILYKKQTRQYKSTLFTDTSIVICKIKEIDI